MAYTWYKLMNKLCCCVALDVDFRFWPKAACQTVQFPTSRMTAIRPIADIELNSSCRAAYDPKRPFNMNPQNRALAARNPKKVKKAETGTDVADLCKALVLRFELESFLAQLPCS